MVEKISEKSYRQFLGDTQNLFGQWNLEEIGPFDPDSPYANGIHECWIKASDDPPEDWFRINVAASDHREDSCVWGFDFEWHLRLETGLGRSPLGLGVQLGAWLLAMEAFPFVLALDRDSSMKDEPIEFRTIEAAREHARRVLQEEFKCSPELKQRGILDDRGYLLLPAARQIANRTC